jgi:hypothetical protein
MSVLAWALRLVKQQAQLLDIHGLAGGENGPFQDLSSAERHPRSIPF